MPRPNKCLSKIVMQVKIAVENSATLAGRLQIIASVKPHRLTTLSNVESCSPKMGELKTAASVLANGILINSADSNGLNATEIIV